IVSELDAAKYTGWGVRFRRFVPNLPHCISLVRPIHKTPSLVTLEFMAVFKESLAPYLNEP
ncbi:MAG: LysR family transcriptional regulator, partial [Pseudomonadota bacterium]